MMEDGDLVFSRVGSVDINALVTQFQKGWLFSGRVLRVRPDREYDSQYLHVALETESVKNDIRSRAVGQTMPSINTEILNETPVIISKELKEQKLIGEYFLNLDRLITLHQNKYLELLRSRNFSLAISWEQRKLAELVTRYEDPVETPHDGYIRLGIRSHAKGTFHEYVEPGHELETAQMHRVAANKLIFNITFAWEHAVAITTEDDAGKLVSHRFPQFTLSESLRPEFLKYVILDEGFHHKLYLASPGGAGRNRVLKIDEALDYPIFYPSVEEQHKIGEFLNRLNDLITLHQREQNHIQIYDYRSILYGSF